MGRVDGGMQRASGAQLVYGELRERILDLSLEPGARLHEAELAAQLRVSRTPLREALRMLLAEDLVEQLPTGGMLVRRLDLQDMRELYAVRAALEGHRALFEALRARDPEAAERTVRDHVLAACREGEAAAAGLLSDRR